MNTPHPMPNSADRKISEVFLEFAEPLLSPLGPHASEAEWNQVLRIAFLVWNAVVYETTAGDSQFLTLLQHQLAGLPEAGALITSMNARKRTLFGNDHRLVGKYGFIERNGGTCLQVEAREPTRTRAASHDVDPFVTFNTDNRG